MAETTQPTALSVRLPFASPEEFLQGYGNNVSRGGIYLRSRTLKAPGTAVTLEIKLQSGQRIIYAAAVVSFVTGNKGTGIPGMGFKFITLDRDSRRFLDSAAAAMPHARSNEPPLPVKVGPADSSPDAVAPPAPPPSQAQPELPSEQTGRLVVQGEGPATVSAPAFEAPPEPPRTGPIIGIDLGTTNSCAAAVMNGLPTILKTREGQSLIPSVVSLTPRGQITVGGAARAQQVTNPKWTVSGFKRLLGRPYDGPLEQALLARFGWDVVATETGECGAKLADRVYTMEQLSALVLREVKQLAELRLGEPVHRAVITVPAWYTEQQRLAVREAGRLAGLLVERMVNEPTAAALSWGWSRRRAERVLVYDLGGGTFDASVLELHDQVYEVVSTGGDTFLGGIDLDQAVVSWLLTEFAERTGVMITDRVALQRLSDAAERAKISLSDKLEARVTVPFVSMGKDGPLDLDVLVSRAQLEKLTRPLIDRTMKVCQEVLESRLLRADQIDEIILVGGQSRAPLVQERITLLFGRRPVAAGNPEEAVALGAALLADSLVTKSGVLLIDVLPMSIGVGLSGGRFLPVIPRNTALPVTRKHRVLTTRDDQRTLEVSVFQGEAGRAQDNTYLGTFTIAGLPPGPRGSVAVELSFELNNECLLSIAAREETTGMEVTTRFATRDTPAAVKARLEKLDRESRADTQDEFEAVSPPQTGVRGFFKRLFGA